MQGKSSSISTTFLDEIPLAEAELGPFGRS